MRIIIAGLALACACVLSLAKSADVDPASDKRPPLPEFRTLGVAPEVQQAILEFGIYTADRPVATVPDPSLAGDLAVFLATLTDGEKISRWVLQLRAVPNVDAAPAAGNPVERYSSTGNTWTLGRRKTTIEVTVLRPLAKRKTTDLLLADEDALKTGMWGAVSINLKLKSSVLPQRALRLEFSDTPFPEERVHADRASALTLGITAAEERSRELANPALSEFLSLVLSTPELLTMMRRVTDVSFFAALRARNEPVEINSLPYESMVPAQQLGVAGADTAYVLPLMVSHGKRPALLCQLAFVPPRSPLQVGAGLVALAAGHPDGKGPILTMELIGSRSAAK